MESIIDRKAEVSNSPLQTWLTSLPNFKHTEISLLAGDAGFRRYYRIHANNRSYVVMDASLSHESCSAFVAIANALRRQNVYTPEIFAADLTNGYLVLTDFGDLTYLNALKTENADTLYNNALQALAKMQCCQSAEGYQIPPFDAAFMWQEWSWHKEWVTKKLLDLTIAPSLMMAMDDAMAKIINVAANQPQLFMHRDYHSGNLMVLEDNVGILDFQDAFIGPVTYDLVSLLRDCYIDWPNEKVTEWVLTYKHLFLAKEMASNISDEEFLQWFDWMGVQRHMKALLTFARKKVRDQNSHYLRFIPRTFHYLHTTTKRYAILNPLYHYLTDYVEPSLVGQRIVCVP